MKKIFVLGIMMLTVFSVSVQAQTPFAVEGPLTAVDPTLETITVMGMEISVPNGTPINSPSATLTLSDLLGDPLPGRGTTQGFLNGTAIVTGTITGGVMTADDVFTEPAENVVLGEVTEVTAGGSVVVNGVTTVELTDPRIPFGGYVNDLGTPVNKADIQPGNIAGAEGYYAGGVLYIFAMEIAGVNSSVTPEVGITRAQGRADTGRLEVRGGLTGISGNQRIELRDAANPTGPVLATALVGEDPVIPGTAEFRFRVKGITVPEVVRVDNVTSPSFATAEVNIR
ncbi:MAG: hypothetical protein P1U85_23455 [Verrucomicrobiales bacterium]|nr:hypothetical protein [Verrucomicrobiales bacterium]